MVGEGECFAKFVKVFGAHRTLHIELFRLVTLTGGGKGGLDLRKISCRDSGRR